MKKISNNRFIVSAKVGSKGQIVIPIEAREMFKIKPGDTLMVLGDKKRGLALMKDDIFYRLMEKKK
ncbi:MAG: AbrB/MazE/SpoVT family DNA-binding domain-containing protein [Bacilli bacterium]|nr:AbrB/MazE/SpoVT family DNA-binding domain-containing protein [Bacilli bacterium]